MAKKHRSAPRESSQNSRWNRCGVWKTGFRRENSSITLKRSKTDIVLSANMKLHMGVKLFIWYKHWWWPWMTLRHVYYSMATISQMVLQIARIVCSTNLGLLNTFTDARFQTGSRNMDMAVLRKRSQEMPEKQHAALRDFLATAQFFCIFKQRCNWLIDCAVFYVPANTV